MFALEPHLEDTLERSIFLFMICTLTQPWLGLGVADDREWVPEAGLGAFGTFPPPGTCLILSLDPHLDWMWL